MLQKPRCVADMPCSSLQSLPHCSPGLRSRTVGRAISAERQARRGLSRDAQVAAVPSHHLPQASTIATWCIRPASTLSRDHTRSQANQRSQQIRSSASGDAPADQPDGAPDTAADSAPDPSAELPHAAPDSSRCCLCFPVLLSSALQIKLQSEAGSVPGVPHVAKGTSHSWLRTVPYLARCPRSSVQTSAPRGTARGLLATSWRQLRRHLPAVLAVAALSDGVMFLLHRLSHRLTNTGAAPMTRAAWLCLCASLTTILHHTSFATGCCSH